MVERGEGAGIDAMDGDGAVLDAFHPEKSAGHIQVDAIGIETDIGAVGVIAV